MRILLIHRSIRSIEVFDPGRASARSASETDGEESRQTNVSKLCISVQMIRLRE